MSNSPSADNLLLGAGVIYLNRYDQNGQLTGDRHLGNCSSFSVNVEVIRKEKPDLRASIYDLPKSVIVGFRPTCSITLNEISRENLALILAGDVHTAYTQETRNNETIALTVKKGFAFQLVNGAGFKVFGLKVHSITAGATVYVEGVDYVVTRGAGIIYIPDTSQIVNNSTVTILYSATGHSLPQISMAHSTNLTGKITYVGEPTAGIAHMCVIDKVDISSSDGISFIGDDFASIQLRGNITSCAKSAVGGADTFCSVIEILTDEQLQELEN